MEKLVVKDGVELEVQNYCHPQYPEDDWSTTLIGSSVDELTKLFWGEHYATSSISITGVTFTKIKYVEYKGRKVIVEEIDYDKDLHKLYKSQFFDDELVKPAEKKRNDLVIARKKQEHEEYLQEQKDSELAKLRQLKEKYPNV